jgi:RNA polymerase sigma-70 factor, ECF subfamily
VFGKLEGFEYRGEGALRAYLRQALMNRIRNEIRNARRRPVSEELHSGVEAPGASPIEAAIGEQAAAQYEAALNRLKPEEREAIIARVELGLTYPEMVTMLGKPSPDAARMAVARALVRLTEEMGRWHSSQGD